MAEETLELIALSPDTLTRTVWVVVDPRDFVTGQRVSIPLRVRLTDVTAEPISALSGVYCFTDLNLAAATYTVRVEPIAADRGRYFDAETPFNLAVVPLPAAPLLRNPLTIDLLPRPAYPFDGQATLARGRLVKASDLSPIEGAQVLLTLDTVDKGLRGRTDERGEFVLFFPPAAPEDNAAAALKKFKFTLRFVVEGHAPHVIGEAEVLEGTTKSLEQIQFPGM